MDGILKRTIEFYSKNFWILDVLQSVTKTVRLAPPASLFIVGCKFAWSFLTTTASQLFQTWHNTEPGGIGIMSIFEQNSFGD